MIAQDQSEVVEFLSGPHMVGADKIEIIETHISCIFLSGDRAYKMKRAVKLPYVEFLDGGIEACSL
ncbi:aminoglycoside phosphotransferase family enzyme [Sinorhizobium fredii]